MNLLHEKVAQAASQIVLILHWKCLLKKLHLLAINFYLLAEEIEGVDISIHFLFAAHHDEKLATTKAQGNCEREFLSTGSREKGKQIFNKFVVI